MQNCFPCKKLLPENKTGCPTTSPRSKSSSFLRSDGAKGDKVKIARAVIPTKDNPPPEMASWLVQFEVCCAFQKILYPFELYFSDFRGGRTPNGSSP